MRNDPQRPLGDDPGHLAMRATLRLVGGLMVVAGLILSAIGIGNFFSAFGTMTPPRYFWCVFAGFPLLGIGAALLRFGFMGAVSRYAANEVVPVASDATRQVLGGSQAVLQDIVHPAGDTRGRLERLERLKDDGLVTAEEYAAKRAEILKAL